MEAPSTTFAPWLISASLSMQLVLSRWNSGWLI
jgi:hypothetical protein